MGIALCIQNFLIWYLDFTAATNLFSIMWLRTAQKWHKARILMIGWEMVFIFGKIATNVLWLGQKSSKIKTPAVIGAVIDLGYCLNLTDYASSEVLERGYTILATRCRQANQNLPQNKPSEKSSDVLLRDLDCAVIQQIHDFKKTEEGCTYDSVRGIFMEGGEVYPGSEFREKTHVQLCIVNPNCIKGLFVPVHKNCNYNLP